jgi:hypothetical protein
VGLDIFSVQVADGNGGSDIAALHITVDPAPQAGQLYVYEGFDYAEGTDLTNGTLNGGTGLAGAWVSTEVTTNDNPFYRVTSDTNSWGALSQSGNRLHRISTGGIEAISRGVSVDLDSGSELWFSFLYDSDSNTGFGITSESFADEQYPQFAAAGPVGFGFRHDGNGLKGAAWDGSSAGPTLTGTYIDAFPVEQVYLLVGKIEFNNAGGLDTYSLYNVGTNLVVGSALFTLTADVDETLLDTITMNSNRGPGFDEIRLGLTLADVIPDGTTPPPQSPFETWGAEYGLTGSDTNYTAHTDTDGMNQLVEYGLGGNPTNHDAAAVLPIIGNQVGA